MVEQLYVVCDADGQIWAADRDYVDKDSVDVQNINDLAAMHGEPLGRANEIWLVCNEHYAHCGPFEIRRLKTPGHPKAAREVIVAVSESGDAIAVFEDPSVAERAAIYRNYGTATHDGLVRYRRVADDDR